MTAIDMAALAREQREDYVNRLLKRVSDIWHREAPKGIGRTDDHWLAMVGPDRDLIRTAIEYENEAVPKAELDKKAMYLLAEWRKQFSLHNTRN